MTESKIQYDICQYLQSKGIFAFSVPNELAGKDPRRMRHFVAMGLRSGVSDLIVLLPNRIIFLEVKTDKGRQSDNQKRFQKKVESLGFEYYVVRSVDEVEKIV